MFLKGKKGGRDKRKGCFCVERVYKLVKSCVVDIKTNGCNESLKCRAQDILNETPIYSSRNVYVSFRGHR